MMQFIKTNWPLLVLTLVAMLIMGIIVDKKRNELPVIREEIRQEEMHRAQEKSIALTNSLSNSQQ